MNLFDYIQDSPTVKDEIDDIHVVHHRKKLHSTAESQTVTIEGIRVEFPLKPYAAQIQMMTKIIRALNNQENALLESPTGSGKSLALLCASLAWRENQERIEAAKLNQPSTSDPNNSPKRKIDDPIPENTKRPKNRVETTLVKMNSDDDFQQVVKRFVAQVVEKPEEPKAMASMEDVKRLKYNTYKEVPRIFIGSRTHKQISQLVNELKGNTKYKPRTTILGSREHLCIHKKVSKSSNKIDDCTKLLDENRCPYANRTHKLLNHPSLRDSNRVWDIEDMVKLGKKTGGCPYYAARKLYEGAEVIFGPYNYIVDPVIRKILDINLRNSIVILDEAHNIEDACREAGSFNIDENAMDILMTEIKLVVKYGDELEAHQKMEVVIENIYDCMRSEDIDYTTKEYDRQACHWTGGDMLNKLKEMNLNSNTFDDLFAAFKRVSAHADEVRKEKEQSSLNEMGYDPMSSQVPAHGIRALSNGSLTMLQGLFTVLKFIFGENQKYADDYELVFMKTMERSSRPRRRRRRGQQEEEEPEAPRSLWTYKIGFWCLNPAVIFRDMCETTHSVILTSGTLSPLSTFASELGTEFTGRLEANHVIQPSQVLVNSISRGPSQRPLKGVYSNIETFEYQDEVGEVLCDISNTVPFGILCFMPSYKALDLMMERWKTTGVMNRLSEKKLVLSEPKGSDKKEFELILNKFYSQIDLLQNCTDEEGGLNGALFFAVFRGKVSEGIDFSDNYCRAVITLGIPYPGFKDLEVNLKKEYNDRMKARPDGKNLLSGYDWYTAQAYRAINQALGRCIRHRNDWGAIILLEERFSNQRTVEGLSRWVKGQFRMPSNYREAIEGLREFTERRIELDRQKAAEDNLKIKEEPYVIDLIYDDNPAQPSSARILPPIKMIEDMKLETDSNTPTPAPSETFPEVHSLQPDEPIPRDTTSKYFSVAQNANNIGNISKSNDWKEEEKVKEEEDDDDFPDIEDMEYENDDTALPDSPNDLMAPSLLSPKQRPSLSSSAQETYSSFHTSQNLVSCKKCQTELMHGPTNDLVKTQVVDLACILRATSAGEVQQILHPAYWSTSSLLQGGPIDINALENCSNVVYDKEDGICYRELYCSCDGSNIIGLVICVAATASNGHHVGKVYLWDPEEEASKKKNNKTLLKLAIPNLEYGDVDIPNSQLSAAMNDAFYNL